MDINNVNVPAPKNNEPSGFSPFTFRGRATRLGMWVWSIVLFTLFIILAIKFASQRGGEEFAIGCLLVPILLLWPTAVRRLHDHGLSGNWLFFLSPVGIALMYMAYVLDLDDSVNPVVEKINKAGGVLGWLYAGIAWFFASQIVLFCLLFLCAGKNEDNKFGPSPYYTPAAK